MRLTVLVDNNTLINKYLLGEPALSFYIEADGKKILFDAGYSDIFIQNAFKLGIDLKNLDNAVFSHGHNDHTLGLVHLRKLYQDSIDLGIKIKKPEIIAHPQIIVNKIDEEVGDVGFPFSEKQLTNIFDLNLTKSPYQMTENLTFLGEIPRKFDFEETCSTKKDCLLDDTAIVYKSSKGLVIVTGCSHSGICNITEYAKEVCNESRIADIIGGFHLLNTDEKKLKQTLQYFRNQNISKIHPCHCTDLKAKIYFSRWLHVKELGSGSIFSY